MHWPLIDPHLDAITVRSAPVVCQQVSRPGDSIASDTDENASARMPAMRRWLLTLLLCVLPVQLVWAAGAPYCAHESDGAAKRHFGHHEHQHTSSTGAALGENDPRPASAHHLDCEACHFGCSMTLPSAEMVIGSLATPPVNASAEPAGTSHIPSGPERPDRTEPPAAARFGGGVANGRSIA
jgi:hypothetical protein